MLISAARVVSLVGNVASMELKESLKPWFGKVDLVMNDCPWGVLKKKTGKQIRPDDIQVIYIVYICICSSYPCCSIAQRHRHQVCLLANWSVLN